MGLGCGKGQMGKTSKWIRNFLLGKKETDKKKEDSNSKNTSTSTAIVARAPKRRWSFGRSANKQVHHRCTRSTSFSSNILARHESEEFETKPNYDKAIVLLPNTNVRQTTNLMPKVKAREAEEAAAIKIQAVFRAYLARKALHALRGLVKLQALIRGYLVRKQATATFRCMHSLMSIQVRTRVHRIQMAEEAELLAKRQSIHRRSSEGNQHNQVYNDIMNMNFDDTWGVFQGQRCYQNQLQMERTGNEYGRYYARNLSMLEHENLLRMYPTSPSLTNKSSSSSFSQLENSLANPLSKSIRETFTFPQPEFTDPVSNDHPFIPSYMANTESSRAKARSHSEPKRRPKWITKQTNQQRTSSGELNVMQITPMQWLQTPGKLHAHENSDPWLSISHYRSKTSPKDGDCDSPSTNLSTSSQYRSQVAHSASNR